MLRIHLLGPFRVQWDDQPLRLPKRRDTTRLWAYLLVQHGQAKQRDAIAEALWPEATQARFNLRHNLHALKAYLAAMASAEPWLLQRGDTLAWNPRAEAWIDLVAFEDTRLSLDAADPQALTPAELLKEAAGELLAGWDDAWLLSRRAQLDAQRLARLENLVHLNVASGSLDRALEFAECLVAADTLREASHRLLIQLLLDQGNRSSAKSRASELLRMLQDDLLVDPAPETLRLLQDLEGDQGETPRPATAPQPGIRFADALDAMPRFSGPLLGQGARRLLARPLPLGALTTLFGAPGVGKSRLAAELVASGASQWPGGRLWLDLSTLEANDSPAQALLAALGLSRQPAADLDDWPEALTSRLALPTLVVLDNADHALDAVAGLARRLFPLTTQLALLVSSRERVGLAMEQAQQVLPLALPPEGAGTIAAASEALELLLMLCRESGDGRPPGPALVADLAAAARAVSGLPDALIRVAYRAIGPTAAADLSAIRLGRLEVIDGPIVGYGSRHPSLSASIGWTLDRLSPQVVLLFERLSLFPGTFSVADAERCCQGDIGGGLCLEEDAVLDGLQILAQAAMLQVDAAEGVQRNRLLGPLRWEGRRRAVARGESAALDRIGAAHRS